MPISKRMKRVKAIRRNQLQNRRQQPREDTLPVLGSDKPVQQEPRRGGEGGRSDPVNAAMRRLADDRRSR